VEAIPASMTMASQEAARPGAGAAVAQADRQKTSSATAILLNINCGLADLLN